MRTTLIIDDHVLREAKRRAIESGMSLSELTTLALREALRQRPQSAAAHFTMPTYGSSAKPNSSSGPIADLRDQGR